MILKYRKCLPLFSLAHVIGPNADKSAGTANASAAVTNASGVVSGAQSGAQSGVGASAGRVSRRHSLSQIITAIVAPPPDVMRGEEASTASDVYGERGRGRAGKGAEWSGGAPCLRRVR